MILSKSDCPNCKKIVPVYKLYFGPDLSEITCCRICGTVFVEKPTLNKLDRQFNEKFGETEIK